MEFTANVLPKLHKEIPRHKDSFTCTLLTDNLLSILRTDMKYQKALQIELSEQIMYAQAEQQLKDRF